MYTYIYIYLLYIHMYIYIYIYICMNTYTYVFINIFMHVYMYIHILHGGLVCWNFFGKDQSSTASLCTYIYTHVSLLFLRFSSTHDIRWLIWRIIFWLIFWFVFCCWLTRWMWFSVMQCVAGCCRVLQGVAVCCNVFLLTKMLNKVHKDVE